MNIRISDYDRENGIRAMQKRRRFWTIERGGSFALPE